MKKPLTLAFLLFSAVGCPVFRASGQVVPSTSGAVPNVGFHIPRLPGSLSYSLNASELISTGFYNSGTSLSTNFGGDLAYTSASVAHPFSAVYSGGVLLQNSGQPTTVYQNLSLSQLLKTKNWTFDVQDGVSYLPESPVGGLSGIPGVGDLGVDPIIVGPTAGIGILTDYGPRVSNTASGTASRLIGAHLSAQASAYYAVQRFVGDNASLGVDNNALGGSGGVSYHFNQLSALTVNYNYSSFTYPGSTYSYTVQGATIDYSRQWTRKLTTDVYVGPQHISSSSSFNLPSSTQISAGATVGYAARTLFYSASYSRGADNGSGVIPGSFSDNVVGGVHRQFGRDWNVSGSLGWSRNTTLASLETYTFDSDSVFVSGQVSRRLGRRFAGFANYTVEHQNTSGNAPVMNAFTGVYQTFAFGISFTPGTISLGK